MAVAIMPSTQPTRTLRRICQILLVLCGLMLALAPRSAIEVCAGDCCGRMASHAATPASCCAPAGRPAKDAVGCPCCTPAPRTHKAANGDLGADWPHVRATCKPGCRITIAYDVELQLDGRAPTHDLPLAVLAAIPTSDAPAPPRERTCVLPPERGPPRIDERAGRRRCTVLLI